MFAQISVLSETSLNLSDAETHCRTCTESTYDVVKAEVMLWIEEDVFIAICVFFVIDQTISSTA